MSKNRKRQWHFTRLVGRRLYEEPAPRARRIDLAGPVRIIVKSPAVTLEIPTDVEESLFPHRSDDELRAQLASERRILRYRMAANRQGLTARGEMGEYEKLWESMYLVERLRYVLRDLDPSGRPVPYPGAKKEFMERKFRELKASVARGERR